MQPAPGLVGGQQRPATAAIAAARDRIDELDRMIINLVGWRREISLRIQRERVEAGGVRIETSREREIVRRYVAGLGKPGGLAVALGILDVCRGGRPGSAPTPAQAGEQAEETG